MLAVPLDCILFAYFKIYCLRVWVLVTLNLGAEIFSSETLTGLGTPLTVGWWWLLFSCSVVSNSLPSHGLQHARLPCPSSCPGVCSNSYPLSRRCHPTISSSVIPFSSHLQPFPESGSFLTSQLFANTESALVAKVLELQLQHQSFQ